MSRKNFSKNAFNDHLDSTTDIEDAPDLPSLRQSFYQQLEMVKKGMKDAPDLPSLKLSLCRLLEMVKEEMEDATHMLSLGIEYTNLCEQLEWVEKEIKDLSKNR